MRHIKLFEGFSTDEYYVEITPEEHDELIQGPSVYFGKDFKKLINILTTNVNDLQVFNGIKWIEWKYMDIYRHIEGIGSRSSKLWIYPLPDEYYLVEYENEYNKMVFYKCDQIDGVIRLLKDLDVI